MPASALNTNCCAPQGGIHEGLAELLRRYNVNDFAASVQVYALKGKSPNELEA